MQMPESSVTPKSNGVTAHDNDHAANGAADPAALEALQTVSVIVLRQAIDFLNDSITTDDQLTFRSKYIPGSTIGKHLRHARDHFILLLDSLNESGAVCHELSYDIRTRNTPMEGSRAAALEAMAECIERLEKLVPRTRLDAPLTLNAITPHMQTFKTTFGRELWFAALHAVHHWSMVRVIAGELNIKLEDSFGIAPSTLIYHGSEGPLGKSKI